MTKKNKWVSLSEINFKNQMTVSSKLEWGYLYIRTWERRWIKCSMNIERKMKTKQTVARAQVGVYCSERLVPSEAIFALLSWQARN